MALLLLLAACGQTGPLYLPDQDVSTPVEIRDAITEVPAAAEAEEKTDTKPPAGG